MKLSSDLQTTSRICSKVWITNRNKAGRELLVMGYSLSYKNWMLIDQGLLNINPGMTNYLKGFPQEIMVVNKFYPYSSGIEDERLRELYGYKFAIEHKGEKYLFIEPYLRTELIGFPEFYHKKRIGFFLKSFGIISQHLYLQIHLYSIITVKPLVQSPPCLVPL